MQDAAKARAHALPATRQQLQVKAHTSLATLQTPCRSCRATRPPWSQATPASPWARRERLPAMESPLHAAACIGASCHAYARHAP